MVSLCWSTLSLTEMCPPTGSEAARWSLCLKGWPSGVVLWRSLAYPRRALCPLQSVCLSLAWPLTYIFHLLCLINLKEQGLFSPPLPSSWYKLPDKPLNKYHVLHLTNPDHHTAQVGLLVPGDDVKARDIPYSKSNSYPSNRPSTSSPLPSISNKIRVSSYIQRNNSSSNG